MNNRVAAGKETTTGGRLKALRSRARLTQTRLAIESGTTAMHIMDLENGHEDFEGKLTLMAKALGCNPLWLETGIGDPGIHTATAERSPRHPPNLAAATPSSELANIFVSLGREMESITTPTRNELTHLLKALADHPNKRHDLARQVDQILVMDKVS